jgi:hypothetical protein
LEDDNTRGDRSDVDAHGPGGSPTGADATEVLWQIAPRLAAHADELGVGDQVATALAGPVARLELPDESQLRVRLVTQHQLERFAELSQDAQLLQNAAFLIAGGLVGFFTNLATAADPPTSEAWLFLAILVAIQIGVAGLAVRSHRRVRSVRADLLSDRRLKP